MVVAKEEKSTHISKYDMVERLVTARTWLNLVDTIGYDV
jgi:hypothetical protein